MKGAHQPVGRALVVVEEVRAVALERPRARPAKHRAHETQQVGERQVRAAKAVRHNQAPARTQAQSTCNAEEESKVFGTIQLYVKDAVVKEG